VASTVSEDNDEEEMKALLETLNEIQIETLVHWQLSELVTMSENNRFSDLYVDDHSLLLI